MKKFKQAIICILLFTAIPGCSAHGATDHHANVSESTENMRDIEPVLDYDSARENPDGTVTYDLLNADEVADFFGEENAVSVKYTVIDQPPYTGPAPKAYEITNITYIGAMVGKPECARTSSYNATGSTISKTLTVTGIASNTNSVTMYAGGTIADATVSAALGFDVTYSMQVSDTTTVELPPYKTVTVVGYPRHHVYRYDIANNKGIFGYEEAGNGIAKQVYGMFTVASIS